MKKLWRIALLTFLGACAALCLGMSAAADEGTIQNGLKEQFAWETDLTAGTLTITGKGYLPQSVHMEGDAYPWAGSEDQIKTLILKGKDIYPEKDAYNEYYCHFLEKIVGELGDGFTWTLDVGTGTVTLAGKGPWPADAAYCFLSKIVISEGITDFGATTSVYQDRGHCLTNVYPELPSYEVSGTVNLINPQRGEYYVDSGNPYYASYDGCLYSKDYTKLITVPSGKTTVNFHPDLQILGTGCLPESITSPLVIPWGVTTLEGSVLTWMGTDPGEEFLVVFPDTLVNISKEGQNNSRLYKRVYCCSESNQAVKSAFQNTEAADQGGYVHVKVLPSLAEYYPDVPEAQGSAFAPESSQPPASQPESGESSAPVVSQPEPSQPSESSSASSQEPAAPSSQPSASSGTSSQPVSEPPSSQPEESSVPEESSAVSEEPSSEVSVSEPGSSLPEEDGASQTTALPEQSEDNFQLWPVLLVLGALVVCAAVVIFFIWRKR